MSTLIEKLDAIQRRHEEVMAKLSEPAVLADPAEYQRLARIHAELMPVVEEYARYRKLRRELEDARALLQETIDPEMRGLAEAEMEALTAEGEALEASLQGLLLPKDPTDDRNTILEVRAGTGGEDAGAIREERCSTGSRRSAGAEVAVRREVAVLGHPDNVGIVHAHRVCADERGRDGWGRASRCRDVQHYPDVVGPGRRQ